MSCLVSKKRLDQMGTSQDMTFRASNIRVDDISRRETVVEARKLIQRGYAVNAKKVLLALTNSGAPTMVSASKGLPLAIVKWISLLSASLGRTLSQTA